MKCCRKCGNEKPLESFNKNSARSDGLQSQCRECTRGNSRDHYNSNKSYYQDRNKEYKLNNRLDFLSFMSDKSCVDCGVDDLRVLEFDHLRDKSFNISERIGFYPLSSLMDEISKCEIVCANCHKIRTAGQFNWYAYAK